MLLTRCALRDTMWRNKWPPLTTRSRLRRLVTMRRQWIHIQDESAILHSEYSGHEAGWSCVLDEGRGWCFLCQMAFLFLTRLHFQITHPPIFQAFSPFIIVTSYNDGEKKSLLCPVAMVLRWAALGPAWAFPEDASHLSCRITCFRMPSSTLRLKSAG